MPVYTIFHHSGRTVSKIERVELPDDAAALAHAREQRNGHVVEVYNAQRAIGKILPGADASESGQDGEASS